MLLYIVFDKLFLKLMLQLKAISYALWLKTSSYGDEKDRVLVKKDGNYTYLLPDIAYHINKLDRGFEELIDVLGADHHGYINRLKASLEILGRNSDALDIKILQMVRLLQDGEEINLENYTLYKTVGEDDSLVGTTGETVTAETLTITGFTYDEGKSANTISGRAYNFVPSQDKECQAHFVYELKAQSISA